MPAKNTDADNRIIEAAKKEFLEKGYSNASLRRIASEAGITTGALFRRYKSKDDLFCSLTQCIVEETDQAFKELKPMYYSAVDMNGMSKAMQAEAETTLHILFDHYTAAALLLCKSEGSSAAGFFDEITSRKIEESDRFFGNFPKSEDLKHAFEVLLTVQFDMYRQILKNGYTKQEAENCMQILNKFINGGWISIMNELMKEREG